MAGVKELKGPKQSKDQANLNPNPVQSAAAAGNGKEKIEKGTAASSGAGQANATEKAGKGTDGNAKQAAKKSGKESNVGTSKKKKVK